MKEVTAELLAAGVTIAQLVADTIRHPQHALDNLAKAMRELGKTVGDIVRVGVHPAHPRRYRRR